MTSAEDSPERPAPGTLRYGLRRGGPTWIVFDRDLTIRLRAPLPVPSDTTLDGRGRAVELTGHGVAGLHVYDANIFYPHRGTLAYSENNLGAGAMAVPVIAGVVGLALAGLLSATYVAPPAGAEPRRREGRAGLAGWLVTFFAVGCPVCNKLVLLALGATGAMAYFEPIQPYLAAASILLLGWALWARVTREDACRLPRRSAPRVAELSDAL